MDKELAKYNFYTNLIKLVGIEKATADLHWLYERHKHDKMFENKNEIDELVKKVTDISNAQSNQNPKGKNK